MKRLLMMILCLSMMSGCGHDTVKEQQDKDSSYNEISDKTDETSKNTDDWYSRFETEMKNKNYSYSTKTSLDASSIGGVEGYRYTTDNGHVDVYRFEDGDDLDKITQNKSVRIDDVDKKVEVNDHYVIVSDGLSDDIMSIFRGLE